MPNDRWAQYAVSGAPSEDKWKQYAVSDPAPPKIATPITPGLTISAAPKPTWLQDAESDVRLGGDRTLVGKGLGRLQGSDKGYSGIGDTPAGNIVASPVIGGIHALQGAIDDFGHPIKGNLKTLQGIAEMATLPSMAVGGPESLVAKGIEAIPSKAHAGELFSDLASRAGDAGTNVSLGAAKQPLSRLSELGDTVARLPKAVENLAKERGPIAYQKARDYASAISSLSAEEKMALKPEIGSLLTRLKTGLHSDISSALEPIGGSGQYGDALKEYAQNARLREGAGYIGKKILQGAGAGAAYEGYKKLKGLL